MKRKFLLIPLIVVVVAAAAGGLWVYARETPRYALYQLKRALVARDMDRAFLYIDLDTLTETMATAMFGTEEKSTEADRKSADGLLRKDMLRELLPSLKKTFKEQAKDQLLAYIGDEKTIRSIDDTTVWAFEIDAHDTTATVLLKKKPLFVMQKGPGGQWRITEIIFKKR